MDIRSINTQNRILNGLIKVLSKKKLSECKTIEIIEQAEISKKTFYNHFKSKEDCVRYVEEDIIQNLRTALSHDREILKNTHDASAKDIVKLANSAFSETLRYCDDHKNELAVLLSNNGDINLYHSIIDLANEEFTLRAPYLFGEVSDKLRRSSLYHFFQTLYVDAIIKLLIFWLNHRDNMSIENVKYLAGIVQTKSSIQLMKLLSKNDKGNKKPKVVKD